MENTGSTGSLVTLVTEGGLDSRSFVLYTKHIGLASRRAKEEGEMWDFAMGQDFVRIERVEGDLVLDLVVELPLEFAAEAETICNRHNQAMLVAVVAGA